MKKKIVFYFSILLILGSCYPDKAIYYSDTDITYTTYEEAFDFKSKKTYAIPDKIVKIMDSDGEDPEYVQEPFNTQMLQKMEANMKDLGWDKVDDPENADIKLLPAVWTNTTIYYWYNNYWCMWYPYYCGWGWGYPSVSSYTTGTLLMTLVVDGEDYIDPFRVWTAASNGLVSGAYDKTRVERGIDQSFEQSPYLNIK